MSFHEMLDTFMFKDWAVIVFFLFFWQIVLIILHIAVEKRLPISNPFNDIRIIKRFIHEVRVAEPIEREKKPRKRAVTPDDYWDGEVNYETGEVGANRGPAIRHPKNADRAYEGSA
jgi:hypothetical protein